MNVSDPHYDMLLNERRKLTTVMNVLSHLGVRQKMEAVLEQLRRNPELSSEAINATFNETSHDR